MGLEDIINFLGKDVVLEVKSHLKGKNYLENLVEMSKRTIPAFVVGALGTFASQYGYQELFGEDNFAKTFIGYWAGYVFGFPTYLGIEFILNKEKYLEEGGLDKFKDYCKGFMAADYVGDFVSYAWVYGLVDTLIQKNTDMVAGASGAIATMIGCLTYTSFMAAFMPATEKLSQIINAEIRGEASNISSNLKTQTNIIINNLAQYGDKVPLLF